MSTTGIAGRRCSRSWHGTTTAPFSADDEGLAAQTPPPAPSPKRRGGERQPLLPLSASGRGPGGGVRIARSSLAGTSSGFLLDQFAQQDAVAAQGVLTGR